MSLMRTSVRAAAAPDISIVTYPRRSNFETEALVKNLKLTVFDPCPFSIPFLDRSCCPAPPGKLFLISPNFDLLVVI